MKRKIIGIVFIMMSFVLLIGGCGKKLTKDDFRGIENGDGINSLKKKIGEPSKIIKDNQAYADLKEQEENYQSLDSVLHHDYWDQLIKDAKTAQNETYLEHWIYDYKDGKKKLKYHLFVNKQKVVFSRDLDAIE